MISWVINFFISNCYKKFLNQSMHKKINIQLILIETAFIFFLVGGLERFYLANQSAIIDAILHQDMERLNALTSLSIVELMQNQIYFPFMCFALGILIIGIMNWKLKQTFLNTLFVTIYGYLCFPLKLIHGGLLPQAFNSFFDLFSDDRKTTFLIGGSVLSAVALFLLWFAVLLGRKISIHKN